MNKMPKSVVDFSAGNADRKEGYSKIPSYVEAYKNNKAPIKGKNGEVSFAVADKDIHGFFISEVEYMSGKKMEDYPDLGIFCNFADVREAAFTVVGMMTDLIMPDALIKSIGMIANFKYGGWGESLSINLEPRDLFVVSKGSQSKKQANIQRQHKGAVTIIAEPRTISVGISLYDIIRGDYSLAEFIMKAVQSLEVQVRYEVFDVFSTAMNALTTTGDALLKVVGYTQNDLVKLCQKVTTWNMGKKAIILGTALALSKILPASTNFRFDIGSEFVTIGHIRDFFGYSCVELEQVADYTTEFKMKLKDTELYVISPSAGKIVQVFFEGSTLANQGGNYDNSNLIVEATLKKSWGVAVATSAIGALMTVTL